MAIDDAASAGPNALPDEALREDPEEDVSGGGEGKPWDASKIRITTKSFTLREIFSQIEDGDIDLAPNFQRALVWKPKQRTRLIESILLGIPLPAFYFNQMKDGDYQVVDGVQRLSTVRRFIAGQDPLGEDLEYLKALEGKKFADLDLVLRRRFVATQIVVHVIEPQTPDELKYDIFSRVNTLGSPLSAQEIRHAMSKPRTRTFLLSLVELPSFDAATSQAFWRPAPGGTRIRENQRMMDHELALRFCAFSITTVETYSQFESLDAFLLDVTRRLDGRAGRHEAAVDDEGLAWLRKRFERAMQNAVEILGPSAFRRMLTGQTRRAPLNRALFEAQALALTDHDLEELTPRKEDVQKALSGLIANPAYLNAITQATGDVQKVQLRLRQTREAVLGALS